MSNNQFQKAATMQENSTDLLKPQSPTNPSNASPPESKDSVSNSSPPVPEIELDQNEQNEDELHPCGYCKKPTLEFCCKDCGEVYYCSEEHANAHWYFLYRLIANQGKYIRKNVKVKNLIQEFPHRLMLE